jgi:hypothetical protein
MFADLASDLRRRPLRCHGSRMPELPCSAGRVVPQTGRRRAVRPMHRSRTAGRANGRCSMNAVVSQSLRIGLASTEDDDHGRKIVVDEAGDDIVELRRVIEYLSGMLAAALDLTVGHDFTVSWL